MTRVKHFYKFCFYGALAVVLAGGLGQTILAAPERTSPRTQSATQPEEGQEVATFAAGCLEH